MTSTMGRFFFILLQEFFGRWACRSDMKLLVQILQLDLDSLWQNIQIQKNNWVNWSSDEGDITDLKSTIFFKTFITVGQLQCEFEFPECPDRDFIHIGRWRMVILFPKISYNKHSELYWPSYSHFKFGAAFRANYLWIRVLPPRFSRNLLHIHHHPTWVLWRRSLPPQDM